jgi:hypothetical protein
MSDRVHANNKCEIALTSFNGVTPSRTAL